MTYLFPGVYSVKSRVMTAQSSVNFPNQGEAQNSGKQYKKRVLRAVFALPAAAMTDAYPVLSSNEKDRKGPPCSATLSSCETIQRVPRPLICWDHKQSISEKASAIVD